MMLTTTKTGAGGATATTRSASVTPTDWHRRQRQLVAASLIAVPGAKRPTHRRWA